MRYFFVLIIVVLCMANTLNAQVHINLNLDSQPIWGPTGNDYVENYYFPDIEAYYNVPQHRFYYNEKGKWISRASLPSRFGSFDLYNSYKVVVNNPQPWKNDATYKAKYASFKGRHDQQPIRDSKDSKYFSNKNHPEHNNWAQQQKNEKNKNKTNKKNNRQNERDNGKNKK